MLYITLSETAAELLEVARSHHWSLDGIELFELINEEGLDIDTEQSILEPSEVELGETSKRSVSEIERLKLEPKNYILVTAHRSENVDDPRNLANIFQALGILNQRLPWGNSLAWRPEA